MTTIDELEMSRLKGLTNKLLAGESIDTLAEEFEIPIPSMMTLKFVCTNCLDEFPMRVITEDMSNVNRYIKCPHCRQASYLSTIQTVNKDRINIDDLFKHFGEDNA